MVDELIRFDKTIIGIDRLITKASTVEEAKALFMAKDVIYSQQKYAADVQPVRRGKWLHLNSDSFISCSECEHEAYWDTDYGQQLFDYCPYCGAKMEQEG